MSQNEKPRKKNSLWNKNREVVSEENLNCQSYKNLNLYLYHLQQVILLVDKKVFKKIFFFICWPFPFPGWNRWKFLIYLNYGIALQGIGISLFYSSGPPNLPHLIILNNNVMDLLWLMKVPHWGHLGTKLIKIECCGL